MNERSVFAAALGEGSGLTAKGHEGTSGVDRNISYLDCNGIYHCIHFWKLTAVQLKLYTITCKLHVQKLPQNSWVNCTDQRGFSKGGSVMTKEGTVLGSEGERCMNI